MSTIRNIISFFLQPIPCAGCGAKVGAGVLAQLPEGIKVHQDPNLPAGFDKSDDASVYKVSEDLALVQTIEKCIPEGSGMRELLRRSIPAIDPAGNLPGGVSVDNPIFFY